MNSRATCSRLPVVTTSKVRLYLGNGMGHDNLDWRILSGHGSLTEFDYRFPHEAGWYVEIDFLDTQPGPDYEK